MKAIVYERYGGPEMLELRDVEKPAPGQGEVLVRVRASSINAADWHYLRGEPYVFRMLAGLLKPKKKVLGHDLAGVVDEVSEGVTSFKPGDEVYGQAEMQSFAEYACTKQDHLAQKPANLSFAEAAAIPLAGHTALLGLRDHAKLQPGQKVLINGASGGVGTFAVQIAKAMGAEVTGVCSTRNVEMVRDLGADHVVDYTQEDFILLDKRFDVVFDNVGNRTLSQMRKLLTPRGAYLTNGGSMAIMLQVLLFSRFASHKLVMWVEKPNHRDLVSLKQMSEAGEIRPVIDHEFPLEQVPEAFRYFEESHAQGKVAITMKDG